MAVKTETPRPPKAKRFGATLKVGGAHLPPPAREASGGEGRLGQSPSGVGGASPRRFVDDRVRLSMAALAQPPRRSRRPRASPNHPPPLPLPATRLRRAGGGRSEKPTGVNLVAPQGEGNRAGFVWRREGVAALRRCFIPNGSRARESRRRGRLNEARQLDRRAGDRRRLRSR